MYMVSVGSSPNTTDVANLTQFSSKTHHACVELEPDKYLEHNQKYFSKVYAFNGAHKQLNVSKVSDGGKIKGLYVIKALFCPLKSTLVLLLQIKCILFKNPGATQLSFSFW